MSRNIHHPNTDRNVAKNRYGVKTTHQKPEAFKWWTPGCDPSIAGDAADGCTGDEPALINGFAQPLLASSLERFSFRLNADGRIQAKGFLDVSGAANGGIAFVMPGAVAGEADFIPPTARNDGFALRVTMTGGVAGVTPASAHIDKTTGNVSVSWAGTTSAYFRAYFMRYTGSPRITAFPTGVGTTNQILQFDWWETNDSSVFVPRAAPTFNDPPVMSIDMIDKIRLYQQGHYSITMAMNLREIVTDHKMEWNDSDAPFGYPDGQYLGSTQGYNALGFLDAHLTRIYPLPDYGTDPPSTYWPINLGNGSAFVEGYITVGSRNITGISDNEVELAYLEILFTPFTIPPQ